MPIFGPSFKLTLPLEDKTVSREPAYIQKLLPPDKNGCSYIVQLVGSQFKKRIAVGILERQINAIEEANKKD